MFCLTQNAREDFFTLFHQRKKQLIISKSKANQYLEKMKKPRVIRLLENQTSFDLNSDQFGVLSGHENSFRSFCSIIEK